jgi:hypothetical protein
LASLQLAFGGKSKTLLASLMALHLRHDGYRGMDKRKGPLVLTKGPPFRFPRLGAGETIILQKESAESSR